MGFGGAMSSTSAIFLFFFLKDINAPACVKRELPVLILRELVYTVLLNRVDIFCSLFLAKHFTR